MSGRPRPGDIGVPNPPRIPDVSPPPSAIVPGPGIPRPSLPDAVPPRAAPDVTPAPRPAPVTEPSVPRAPGADPPPRAGVDGADLPPGQRNSVGPDAPPVPPGRTAADAASATPPQTLTQRARNAAASMVPSVGIGVGLTALTMFIQQSANVAMAAVGADAGLKALDSILEFLGEPVNLAIISGVAVVILMPKGK